MTRTIKWDSIIEFKPKRLEADPGGYSFCDLIEFAASVDYEPAYAVTRKELAHIRCLKDDACNYIWRAGDVYTGFPSLINGCHYLIVEGVPHSDTAKVFVFDYLAWHAKYGTVNGVLRCDYCGSTSKDSRNRCSQCGADR